MSVICILLINSRLLFNVTEKVILEAGCLSDISDPNVFITKCPQGHSVTQGREDRTAHEEKTSRSWEYLEDEPFPTESTMLWYESPYIGNQNLEVRPWKTQG